jgi:hypothetical protein
MAWLRGSAILLPSSFVSNGRSQELVWMSHLKEEYPNIQYSRDYPIFGYPTFRFIRRVVSQRYILPTINSACTAMNHATPSRTFSISCTPSLLRRWRDLAAEKGKEAESQKQTSVTHFLKKKPSFTNLHYVEYWFCL